MRASDISLPLYIIFRNSLDNGIVPVDWKRANVSVIYKKGARNDCSNYRPISLTAQACKIFEGIIKDALCEHLHKYNLIRQSQHGFMRHKSCLTNLLEFLEFVSKYVDKGVPVDVIYLDFKKAFDRVPHSRLLSKVKALGINGLVAQWISHWLYDRRQRVVINGKFSTWSHVLSGVSQGSVLGPILFKFVLMISI